MAKKKNHNLMLIRGIEEKITARMFLSEKKETPAWTVEEVKRLGFLH